jgi:hypothetical protein
MELKKKKSFLKKFSLNSIIERNFIVSIDGSDTSEYAFDLVQENFLAEKDQLSAFYIFNSQKDSSFNYKNKKEIIMSKYKDKIESLNNPFIEFLTEDKTSAIHPLEQTHTLALKKKSNFLICGFTGMKGPRGDNMELTKGIDYLLRNCTVPFVLIKDKTIRKERKDEKYRWLCVIDTESQNNQKAFQAFLPLIETEKDEVTILCMMKNEYQNDFYEDIFTDICKENNIFNYTYETMLIEKNIALIINKKINFDENPYDFVILLNNRSHYSSELEKSNNFSILGNSKCNICVFNQ